MKRSQISSTIRLKTVNLNYLTKNTFLDHIYYYLENYIYYDTQAYIEDKLLDLVIDD